MPEQPTHVGGKSLEGWLSPGRFALGLAVLILAAFPQVVLGLQSFVVRDFGFFAYPGAFFQRECLWNGELPLWNPYSNCGVPFLAQWNTMPLYPPALFYLLLPLKWALSVFCLAHLPWAGLGMYCLAERWTGKRVPAALAGVIFAFNGFTLNLLMWPSHIATFSWMPWVVWLTWKGWQEGGRWLVVAALAGALQMLAGGPETILMTWLFLLVLLAADVVGNVRRQSLKTSTIEPGATGGVDGGILRRGLVYGPRFALTVVVVAALAAVQLMPFLDLAIHSQREQGYADARWSMPGWGWANFFVPLVFGRVWNMGVFFQHGQSWTSSYYVGIVTILLTILAAGWVRGRRTGLLTGVGVVSLILAMGDQMLVGRWLRELVPQLTLITYPVKYVTWFVFVVPLLAACGLAGWLDGSAPNRRRLQAVTLTLLLIIGGILVWAWKWPMAGDDVSLAVMSGATRAVFLIAATWLLLLLKRGTGRWAALAPAGLLLCLWGDAYTHSPQQNPTVEPWVYEPGLARAKLELKPEPQLGASRVMVSPAAEVKFTGFIMKSPRDNYIVKRLGLFANCNLLDGLPKVNGFFSLYPRECGELNSAVYGDTNRTHARLAEFMSVSHRSDPERVDNWLRVTNWMPLVTAGQRPLFLDDTNALGAVLNPTFDFRRLVILPPAAKTEIRLQGPGAQNQTNLPTITNLVVGNTLVSFTVESKEAAICVLSQSWYHRWRVAIDGQPAQLWRANYAFQALEVPEGRHEVRLRYEDPGLMTGGAVSGIALLGCVAFLGWHRRSNRSQTTPEPS